MYIYILEMYSNCNGILGLTIFVFLTIISGKSGSISPFTKYDVFVGRNFSTDTKYTIVSQSKIRCLLSLTTLTTDIEYTMAVYNELSKSCTISLSGNQSLFLYETGNNDIVALWNTNVCSLVSSPDSAYYEYKDTDLYSFDMSHQTSISSLMECARICYNEHGNAFKGFVYHYATKRCHCKSVSAEEFQELGHSLNYLSGYSYYNRVCFN